MVQTHGLTHINLAVRELGRALRMATKLRSGSNEPQLQPNRGLHSRQP